MTKLKFLNKKRVVTLTITLMLFVLYVGIGMFHEYIDKTSDYPQFARAMLVVTMIYVLGGCILQTFGHTKVVKFIGTAVFVLLCVFLFYSRHWYDFVIFALCMILVLHRSCNLCDDSNCNISGSNSESIDSGSTASK